MFKRQSPESTTPVTINNTINNYYAADAKSASSKSAGHQGGIREKLVCKSAAFDGYQNSLNELLKRGNVVTMDAHGKKVFLCYRPNRKAAVQQQAANVK